MHKWQKVPEDVGFSLLVFFVQVITIKAEDFRVCKGDAEMLERDTAGKIGRIYAVVNAAAMNARDMAAVERYLAGFEPAPAVVDASACQSAQQVYEALRTAAGGEVPAGVQLFGTADMVPAFRIQYRAQLTAGVKTLEPLCTDLFYANFSHQPELPGEEYSVREHLLRGWKTELVPQWPVARLPLQKGRFEAFLSRYEAFVHRQELSSSQMHRAGPQPRPFACRRDNPSVTSGDSSLSQGSHDRGPGSFCSAPEMAVFYNPLFAARRPRDDLGRFLKRMREEFGLNGLRYHLYGNLKGDYPVIANVLGDFSAENMARENREGVREYLIASHGKRDRIEACFFENKEEKRLPVLDMENISGVLGANPYYLDAWACLNAQGMGENLVSAAMNGQCMGAFAATAILSNNGVDWQAGLADMARSNFYYFYYHYLKALHGGETRSRAFFAAQRAYALALMQDAARPLRAEGNVQFNLYNLLAYHNFGVMENGMSVQNSP